MHLVTHENSIATSRYYVFRYIKEFTGLSLSLIGLYTFNKNHATVLSGIKRLKNFEDTEQDVRDNVAYFNREIKKIFEPDYKPKTDSNKALKITMGKARLHHSIK